MALANKRQFLLAVTDEEFIKSIFKTGNTFTRRVCPSEKNEKKIDSLKNGFFAINYHHWTEL